MVADNTHPGCFPVVIRRWFRKAGGISALVCPVLVHKDSSKHGLVVDDREGTRFDVPLPSMWYCIEDLLRPLAYAPGYLPKPEIRGACTVCSNISVE